MPDYNEYVTGSFDPNWVAVIDESFQDDVFWIGVLLLPDLAITELQLELDAIMQRAWKDFGVPADAELHGIDIFHGRADWHKLAPWQRIKVYNWALDAIGRYGEIIHFTRVDRNVDTMTIASERTDHASALLSALSNIQNFANTGKFDVVVLADLTPNAPTITSTISAYRKSNNLNRINSLTFRDSSEDRAIQAIDLVLYLRQRIASGVDDGKPRVHRTNRRLWDHFANSIKIT